MAAGVPPPSGVWASWSPSERDAYAAGIVMPVAGTVLVLLRLLAKRVRGRNLGADDYCFIIGLVLVWGLSICVIVGVALHGFGAHTLVDPVTHKQVVDSGTYASSKIEYAFLVIDRLAFGIIKTAIMLWYRQIFMGPIFNTYSTCLIVFLAAWSLAFFLATVLSCGTDVSIFWSLSHEAVQRCVNTQVLQICFCVTDVFTDLLVLCTPIPLIWRLRMKTDKKIGTLLTFALGLFSTAAGCVKLGVWIWITFTTTTGYRDFQGYLTLAMVWGLVSAGMALIAGCLPGLRPLMHRSSAEIIADEVRSTFRRSSISSFWSARKLSKASSDKPSTPSLEIERKTEVSVVHEAEEHEPQVGA